MSSFVREYVGIMLDTSKGPRDGPPVDDPDGKVAGSAMSPRGAIDARHVRPDAEVADVEHPGKAKPERLREREDVDVQAVNRPVYVARGVFVDPHRVHQGKSRGL